VSDLIRLFIAIDISDTVRDMLAGVQERMRRGQLPVAWAAPAGMHLTLRFLGATPADRMVSIAAAMRAAAAVAPPFTLSTGAPGAFPNMQRPAVLWMGVGGAVEQLDQLHAALSSALMPLGYAPEERPFHPHLTLGRVRGEIADAARARIAAALRENSAPPLAWRVDRIHLYQSELTPEGARYTRLHDVQLG
jgi:2'-5' RNA ligase